MCARGMAGGDGLMGHGSIELGYKTLGRISQNHFSSLYRLSSWSQMYRS